MLLWQRSLFKVAFPNLMEYWHLQEGYPAFSGTWLREHPLFYGLLFYSHKSDVAFGGGDPALYLSDMDHADVGAFLS